MGLTMRLVDSLLDRSVFWSFDHSGFVRHQRGFDDATLDRSMQGKVCLITGANAGLGYATARGLAERGARVFLLCRNPGRGEAARSQLVAETGNATIMFERVDLSSLASVRAFARRFDEPRVDVLVHNAGLLPTRREVTAEGFELTVATHLLGPHLLTRLLAPALGGGRVIFVSSGGMYVKRLEVDALVETSGDYDGVAAYARTKRGQVVLAELWAAQLADQQTSVCAMHPGWAATSGVERSLPRFWRVMRDRLRSTAEGADTVLWLCVADHAQQRSGQFFFDRQAVSTHLLPWTHEGDEERERLWALCETAARSR